MTKTNITNQTKMQNKQIILEIIKTQKPETTQQLMALVQTKSTLSNKEIKQLLIELENDENLHFSKSESSTSPTIQSYLFSKKAIWYWTIIVFSVATLIAVFAIPADVYPIVDLRAGLGIIFLLYLPGYVFLKTLFPATNFLITTSDKEIAAIERIALSIGISLALIPIVGLILNYTPWGIRLIPLTLTLLAFTLIFATAAVWRSGVPFVFFIRTKTNKSRKKTDLPQTMLTPVTHPITPSQPVLQETVAEQPPITAEKRIEPEEEPKQGTVKEQPPISTEKRIEPEEEPQLVKEPIPQPTTEQANTMANRANRILNLETLLKSEQEQLALELTELAKAVNEKQNELNQEINATREEIKKLKSLLNDKDTQIAADEKPKPKTTTTNKEKSRNE